MQNLGLKSYIFNDKIKPCIRYLENIRIGIIIHSIGQSRGANNIEFKLKPFVSRVLEIVSYLLCPINVIQCSITQFYWLILDTIHIYFIRQFLVKCSSNQYI